MNIYILQVLGRFDYRKVKFRIGDEEYETTLTSIALQKYLSNSSESGSKIILLAPTSLITMKEFDNNRSELLKLYVDDYSKFKERFSIEVENLIQSQLVDSDANDINIYVFESMGKYRDRDTNIVLEYHIDPNTIKTGFINLLMSLDNPSQFYVDISTGLNQYINLMMDAYRGYIVQRKLSRLESYHLKTYYTLTKPVKEEGEECKIYIQEYDVKAFLEWPFKNSRYSISNLLNEDPNSKKKFCKEQQELNGLIYRFISYTKLCFNSVKYNIPILLFERPFIDGEGWIEYDWLSNKVDILKEELINITNGLLKPVVKKSGDTYTVKSRSLNYNYLLNLYITISLYNGLRTTLGLPLRNPSFKINRYVEGPFKSVIEGYKKLNLPLNNRFLDRDLREIWIYYDKLGSDWTTLSELMNKGNNNGYDDRKKPSIYKSDEVRNFFAHSGFLRDITMARKKNGCIEIRYDVKEKTLERIGNWIKNPENY